MDNPAQERLPLLITWRDFTKAATAKELITHAIVNQYQLSFVGDPYDIFDELNRRGKIVLILDGFDEMARKVDTQKMVDNFYGGIRATQLFTHRKETWATADRL